MSRPTMRRAAGILVLAAVLMPLRSTAAAQDDSYVTDGTFLSDLSFRAADFVEIAAVSKAKDKKRHKTIRKALKRHLQGRAKPLMKYLKRRESDACVRRHVGMNLDQTRFDDFFERTVAADGHLGRACSELMRGKNKRALQSLEKALGSSPRFSAAYLHRAIVRARMGDAVAAGADYREAQKTPQNHAQKLSQSCACHAGMEREAEILRKNMQKSMAAKAEGVSLFQKKRFASAVERFTRAISIDPSDPETYLSRGVAREASGDDKGALRDYEKAEGLPVVVIDLRTSILMSLARTLEKTGDLAGAAREFGRVVEIAPEESPHHKIAVRRLKSLRKKTP